MSPRIVITDADRAWAKEQIEKHGPPPQHLVDHVNRLRREYAEKLRKEDEEGHVE